jgi:acyl-homoserine-lactone acylase
MPILTFFRPLGFAMQSTPYSTLPYILSLIFSLLGGLLSSIPNDATADEPVAKRPALGTRSVTIQRDEWGVAHVHGKTHADAFFGMGFAQAEDYFWQLEDTCIQSLGRYAEVTGPTGLSGDILNRSFEIVRRSQEDFGKLKPQHQAMATAYTDGINHFLAQHPETKLRLITHFEPWFVLAMDRQMILDFLYRRSHVARPGDRQPGEIADQRSLNLPAERAFASWDVPSRRLSGFAADVQAAIGSNAWAISGTKTASGSAMLFINPHQPWYGMGQFHEAHLRSDEGLNFTGASFFGNPFPTIGHNEYLGWTYTVNNPDISDTWRVTFDDPTNPLKYRFDGGSREAVQWSETLKVKQDDTLVERQITFRKTHQGPIVSKENDSTFLAVQVAGLFDMNRATQAWGMVLAKNFDEWKSAISHCAIPMFNVVYADRAGNIFYAYNGAIPVRDPAFNWTQPVDGSDARTDWKGIHPFNKLPQVFNPKSGYVQSCNSSPFTTTDEVSDNPQRADFPKDMLEDADVDMRRSKMSRLLLGKATGLKLKHLEDLAYDSTLYWPLTELPKLREDYLRLQITNPALAAEVLPYFTHLLDWDCKSTLESTQTTLCIAWYEELYSFGYPAETLKPGYAADRLTWFEALERAAKKVKSLYGDWKYAWGKAHRLQRIPNQPDVQQAGIRFGNLEPSLPIAGAPGPLGIIYTVYSTPEIPLYRPQRYAVVGASYMAVVEFTESVQGKSIMPFGASGRRKSPHFFDQSKLYSTKQFKPAWFQKEEVTRQTKTTTDLSQ